MVAAVLIRINLVNSVLVGGICGVGSGGGANIGGGSSSLTQPHHHH